MNILFQEPFVDRRITFGKFEKGAGSNTFPYGVACIAAYMRDRGHKVYYLEPNLENISFSDYKQYLISKNIELVGIGSTTLQIGKTLKTFEKIKKINPKIITVLGGIHGTIMPKETLKESGFVDYIVLGEGEKPFNNLVNFLEHKGKIKLKNINGIAYREKGKIIVNPPNFDDMLKPEEMPFPAYDLFPMNKYVAQITYAKTFPSYSLLCSRGCVFRCAFCNACDVFGGRVRYRPVDTVIEEILYLKQKYNAKGLFFQDSTFTCNNQWVKEFCKKMIEKRINIPWACGSRTDTVNEELLRLMKRAGCWEISFGIESGNQKSLDLINKKTTVEQNTKILKLSMKTGIYTFANYILCLPGETKEDVLNTIRYAKKMATPMALFYLPIPFPKTALWDICKKKGILRENAPWEEFNAWDISNPVYINPLIGKEEMKRLLNYAFTSYYRTPSVILKNLKEIILLRQSIKRYWLALKGMLGLFRD
jgi:radical SAM superfamily enzyme YgiQ (UPF0313 family)